MKPRVGSKSIPVSKGAGTDPKQMKAGRFVDRTRELEAMRQTSFDSGKDFIPGHKKMAGMG